MEPHQTDRPEVGSILAAQYLRMSTDHQRYSIDNQRDVIGAYAASHDLHIVQTYTDPGRSGLTLAGRVGLRTLLKDVLSGEAGFTVLVVYDVSRWGRFQDADESAYYEFLCRRAGVHVIYCAEPFENDGSPLATILKSVKRAMAGEYSRELSIKVFLSQARGAEQGFKQGGMPGYGLRRQLQDVAGRPKAILNPGDRKALNNDRVVLVLGPDEEVAVVRRIFRSFAITGLSQRGIAEQLNSEGIANELGRPWQPNSIGKILTNERYIGNYVWNKRSFKLRHKTVQNPPQVQIRADAAFEAIVDHALFERTQEIIRRRVINRSDDELLDDLRELYAREGRLSTKLIESEVGMAQVSTYWTRFGSLVRAYDLIGYVPPRDFSFLRTGGDRWDDRRALLAEVAEGFHAHKVRVKRPSKYMLLLNRTVTLHVRIARHGPHRDGGKYWQLGFMAARRPDLTLVARMNEGNCERLDYYLFPRNAGFSGRVRMARDNGPDLDRFRLASLDALYVPEVWRGCEESPAPVS